MNPALRIDSSGTSHDLHAGDLPLVLSLAGGKLVLASDPAQADAEAWLEAEGDGIHFRAAPEATVPIKYNNAPTGADSVLLKEGDSVQVADVIFRVSVTEGTTLLRHDAHSGETTLQFSKPKDAEVPVAPVQPAKPVVAEPNPADQPAPDVSPQIRPIEQKQANWTMRLILMAVFLPLIVGLVFVLIVASVEVEINPAPDEVAVGRFPFAIKMGERFMAIPGTHRVQAEKAGYHDLNERVAVGYGDDPTFTFTMNKLPGQIVLRTEPVEGAEVYVDGELVGTTPLTAEVEAGSRQFRFLAERYLPHEELLEVEGMGIEQSIDVVLKPGWGTLQVTSVPEGAEVRLNGDSAGATPLEILPMAGNYTVSFHLDEYQEASREVEIQPGEVVSLETVVLVPLEGRLTIQADPEGTNIMLNGEFLGTAPGEFVVPAMKALELQFLKGGYKPQEQVIELEPDATESIRIKLEPEFGTVFVTSNPADAELYVDGVQQSSASKRLRLSTLPHVIEIKKDGYETRTLEVTPNPGVAKKLDIQLETLREVRSKQPVAEIKTGGGQVLREIRILDPITIDMGASRREAGRQSNELQYQVTLTRSFFISTHEVTNAEFARFNPEHDSGSFSGHRLDRPDQPVVSVSWDAAARYLNWLSEQDGLQPAYVETGGAMAPVVPVTNGYRMPTEAEWAFVARYGGDARPGVQPIKYPWGNERTPPAESGNYAGTESVNGIPLVIQSYKDDFPASAPVGEFAPNGAGIADLGGNVSEWCHDYYDLRLMMDNTVLVDPTGPSSGRFHVIRGSSWRHGGIKELRLTYRDYAEEGRNDLGFRIVRYADE
ncbi:MAG: PEGA domain-containing protein [Puniceicoccaceae bacterium]